MRPSSGRFGAALRPGPERYFVDGGSAGSNTKPKDRKSEAEGTRFGGCYEKTRCLTLTTYMAARGTADGLSGAGA